ncbi:MAG: PAS domain-containing protein [Sphingopyxis sp.]|uniref:PAS domain-containing protein n=1 Tax=Sphingopyxis sp. TaxID=1908224 RepID=UPI001A54114F|nr:PAS domain-containing protein [Sphingopyxis sp.]MBL9066019.1 PAS domain-containing protein [Sphingopyxis sp.]HEV7343621.1 PAS domain-containing protein [Sphingopyxis sp.]
MLERLDGIEFMMSSDTDPNIGLAPALAWSEADRVAALEGYAILDTPVEAEFDDVVRLAAETFAAPIAVVNLVSNDRQWFKAEVGIGARELPLDVSICAHAILQNDFLVVPDTRKDPRLDCNPLVTADDGLRFYAGAILRSAAGLPIGTVCVLDREARPDGITAHQRLVLEVLARQVMTQLELRKSLVEQKLLAADLRAEVLQRADAETALRGVEERYRLVSRATNDAVWDWDFATDYVIWNEALEAAHGHRPDAVKPTGAWWIAHIHPDDRARVDASIHAAIDGSAASWSDEYRFLQANGDYAAILDRGHIIRDDAGKAVRMIGAMLDLTERQRTRAILTINEERLRLATDAAEVGFWDVDIVNDVLIWPPIVKEMFGISPDVPVSMADFYAGIHPDDQAATFEAFSGACDPARRALYDVDYRTVGKEDGKIRWVAAKGRGIFDGEGNCVRVVGTAIDVTARKYDEAELRELNDHLERRVAEAIGEREKIEEALRQSQKMEAVGQLTGGIAHDFNNMLAVIIGSLDLLGRRLGDDNERERRYVDAAAEASQRAAVLTQRLLAFSRQQPLNPEVLDPNKLVPGMSELLSHTLGAEIRQETVLAAGLWRTHADRNQLENAILNLAVNARDAMPDGGRLTIETQNTHIDERYAASNIGVPHGQYVMIAISDTGAGMSPDVIAKAFDPFFTTKSVGKGTGLGLSQVYGFVKQSGGHVKIYSEAGEGTTIKIYLPRFVGQDVSTAEEKTRDLPRGERRELILVVEDEPAVRQFSVDALTELGYGVIEADGAVAALRLLDSDPEIALLFTDIVMPDINGRKLADEALRRRPGLKVLYTTGYTRNAVVHNGVVDPGVELISKPFTVEQLATKIRSVLEA